MKIMNRFAEADTDGDGEITFSGNVHTLTFYLE